MSAIIKNEVKRLVGSNKRYVENRNENEEPNKPSTLSFDSNYSDANNYFPPYAMYPTNYNPVYYQYPMIYNDFPQTQAKHNAGKATAKKEAQKKGNQGGSLHAENKKEKAKKDKKDIKRGSFTNQAKKQRAKKQNRNIVYEKVKSQLSGINFDPRRAKSRELDLLEDGANGKGSLSARGCNVGRVQQNAMINILRYGKKKESTDRFIERFRRNYNRINEKERVKLSRRKISVDESCRSESFKKGAESEADEYMCVNKVHVVLFFYV
jgi:hypothetical protein